MADPRALTRDEIAELMERNGPITFNQQHRILTMALAYLELRERIEDQGCEEAMHRSDCARWMMRAEIPPGTSTHPLTKWRYDPKRDCTCGLRALLAPTTTTPAVGEEK